MDWVIMACLLLTAKPFPKAMLILFQLDLQEKKQLNFNQHNEWLFHENAFEMHPFCSKLNYDMTAMVLVGNENNFAIAAGLIRLHMPGGK